MVAENLGCGRPTFCQSERLENNKENQRTSKGIQICLPQTPVKKLFTFIGSLITDSCLTGWVGSRSNNSISWRLRVQIVLKLPTSRNTSSPQIAVLIRTNVPGCEFHTACRTLFLHQFQVIFGTGDSLQAITVTANVGVVRAAALQVRTSKWFFNPHTSPESSWRPSRCCCCHHCRRQFSPTTDTSPTPPQPSLGVRTTAISALVFGTQTTHTRDLHAAHNVCNGPCEKFQDKNQQKSLCDCRGWNLWCTCTNAERWRNRRKQLLCRLCLEWTQFFCFSSAVIRLRLLLGHEWAIVVEIIVDQTQIQCRSQAGSTGLNGFMGWPFRVWTATLCEMKQIKSLFPRECSICVCSGGRWRSGWTFLPWHVECGMHAPKVLFVLKALTQTLRARR